MTDRFLSEVTADVTGSPSRQKCVRSVEKADGCRFTKKILRLPERTSQVIIHSSASGHPDCMARNTYVTKTQGESDNDRNDRAIRLAAKW